MIRVPQRNLRATLLLSLLVSAIAVSVLLGGSPRDIALIAGVSLTTLLCVPLLSVPPIRRERTTGEKAAGARATPSELPVLHLAAPRRTVAGNAPPAPLADAVVAFQKECTGLMLDAEAARVQSESCEGGVRAVDRASRSLAATCDVLGRRAGLTQSHALMARCATADALEFLRHAIDCAESYRRSMKAAANDDVEAGAAGFDEVTMDSLVRASDALGAALERSDEAARVAAELGGVAARGQRHALNLGEACAGLAPSLNESARTGMRLSMLAASLDESADRVARMLSAASAEHSRRRASGAATNWRGAVTGDGSRVTEEDGNVVWVRFEGPGDKPGAGQA